MSYVDWKLLCDFDGVRKQLYDIITDPGETNNLAQAAPEIAKELTKKVASWYQAISGKK